MKNIIYLTLTLILSLSLVGCDGENPYSSYRVNIVFDGSMTDTEVKVNGRSAGPVHQGAFYRFRYDISKLLKYGKDNLLRDIKDAMLSVNNDSPIYITVQSVLDGRIVGESVSRYQRQTARAMG